MGRGRTINIVIGVLVLGLLGVLAYRLTRPKTATISEPQGPKIEEKIEERFRLDIPDGVEKAELKDVSGGTGSGIATRQEILADLPEPPAGEFYQAWLEKDGKLISVGKLRVAKGGWLLEYNPSVYPGYDRVIVSLEKTLDSSPETRILEGSFK